MNVKYRLWRLATACRRLLAKPRWHRVARGPLKDRTLFLRIVDSSSAAGIAAGNYDAFLYEELEAACLAGSPVIWDVGAHHGYHALGLAASADGAKVHAFEPNPYNCERIRRNLEANRDLAARIQVHQFALADKDGVEEFSFHMDVDAPQSSGGRLCRAPRGLGEASYRGFRRCMVNTRCIDGAVADGTVPIPDFVKLDVEGAEHLVLSGARRLLAEHRPRLVLEIHNVTALFHTMRLLNGLGYDLRLVNETESTGARCFVAAS